MARKKRDYKAEYARRVALAQSRGHRNYYEQRKRIERAEIPSLAPTRLRRKDRIERQEAAFGRRVFGAVTEFSDDTAAWLATVDVQDTRIQMARDWSDWYSRHWSTEFDSERARVDSHYLDVYMQAFVLAITESKDSHHLSYDEYQREWFVDIQEYYEAEEYDDRYSDD